MANFDTTTTLPATGCTREDIYNLIETIKPLADLVNSEGLQISSDKIHLAAAVPRWVKYTKTFSDFSTASTTNNIELFQLPAGGVIHAVKLKHSAAFTGGAISAYTLSLGITGTLTKYLGATSVYSAASATGYRMAWAPLFDNVTSALTAATGVDGELASASTTVDGAIAALSFSGPSQAQCNALRDACETIADDLRTLATRAEKLGDDYRQTRTDIVAKWAAIVGGIIGTENHGSATSIRLAATSTGANLSAATAGSVDCWVLTSVAV